MTILLTHTTNAGHDWRTTYSPGDELAALESLRVDKVLTKAEAEMIAERVGKIAAGMVKASKVKGKL